MTHRLGHSGEPLLQASRGTNFRVARQPGLTAGGLFPRVKHPFKFTYISHHGVEVGLLAKVHFTHFLVVPAEGFFEPGTGREPKSSLFREFISRAALAKEVLLMLRNLLQQIEVP